MSYSVLFDKQFIDLGDGRFIPVLLEGCSSGTSFNQETNKWQIDRTWEARPHLAGGVFAATLEEMQAVALASRNEDRARYEKDGGLWDDNSWGSYQGYYHNPQRNMTFRSYQNIFTFGCKRALTVEQLKSVGVNVRVSTGCDAKERGIESFTQYLSSTEQLLDFVNKYAMGDCVYLALTGLDKRVVKLIKSRFFPVARKPKEQTNVVDYFKVHVKDLGFFARFLKNGFKYTEKGNYAHKFTCMSLARKCVDRINADFPNDVVEIQTYKNGLLI